MKTEAKKNGSGSEFKIELVDLKDLKPHPRNYRSHPEDQMAHLQASLKQNGFYRNIVVASDNVILAGHGVADAARKIGKTRVPVVRLSVKSDHPRALKVMAGDNEVGRIADVNDRMLTDLLKEIMKQAPDGLLGTGFDPRSLAALAMVTRTQDELKDFDAAAHWVGMPEFDATSRAQVLIIQFDSKKNRADLMKRAGIKDEDCRKMKDDRAYTTWWPPKKNDDRSSLRFQGKKAAA